jgi:hypothetical protein
MSNRHWPFAASSTNQPQREPNSRCAHAEPGFWHDRFAKSDPNDVGGNQRLIVCWLLSHFERIWFTFGAVSTGFVYEIAAMDAKGKSNMD